MNTKKLIALLLCAAMAASILCACQLSDTDTPRAHGYRQQRGA